ncbi:MAG: Ig-like domain-containing protein, partial [Anaerolineae bacterium]|nr:Ig-like domain-containing protein [Anaerolineae bacterium]
MRWIGLVLIALFLTGCGGGTGAPPPEAPTLVPAAALPTVTPPPTKSPAEVAATVTITITAPAEGERVDMGQPLTLVAEAAASSGVRQVTFTSNGQNIGQARGMDQQTVRVEQPWTPPYAGTHHVVATLGDREGHVIRSETLRLHVVDQALLAANAPLWNAVESNVTAMRGLGKQEPIVPNILSRTELRQRLRAESYYTEQEARRDVLVYSAFDFMPRNFDLYSLTRRYMGDSLAGFYDPATKEFVVVSDDDEMNALEQWVYAHEFMHALQDQHFDLALITDTTLSFDGNMAIRAIAEGEAELLQEHYITQGYLSDDQLIEIFNLVTRRRQSGTNYVPPILSTSFLFPYERGLEFAEALYTRGGWAALNQAWQNPPRSTEQILHVDRFLAGDAPQIVSLAPLTDTLGAGYELLQTDVFGEFL